MTSFNPNYLPKALLPHTITLRGRILTYEFGGDTVYNSNEYLKNKQDNIMIKSNGFRVQLPTFKFFFSYL